MSENCEKCRSVSPKAQDVILKCLVLFTTGRYSVYCHGGRKENRTFKLESENCFVKNLPKLSI